MQIRAEEVKATALERRIEPHGMVLQDTGDTRETPAIDVCKGLIGDGGHLNIYDPQVSKQQMLSDLSTPK